MNNQVMVIDDDNSDVTVDEVEMVEILEKNPKQHNILKRVREMDTIVIDDEPTKDRNNIIEIDYTEENEGISMKNGAINKPITYYYDIIFKENKLLSEFIEKCLDLENSDGMLRVINRTLLKIYKQTDETYRTSSAFNKILLKSIKNLDLKPEFKFSHVKELCEILKCHSVKKKVQFVTLETNLQSSKIQNKTLKSHKKALKWHNDRDKQSKTENIDVIDLDDSEQDNVIDQDDDVILLEDKVKRGESKDKENNTVRYNSGNNNHVSLNSQINKTGEVSLKEIIFGMDAKTLQSGESTNTHVIEKTNKSLDQLLVPIPNQNESDHSHLIMEKIKKIENDIAKYKEKIRQLDLEEVHDDTIFSPYIQSVKLKAKIVALYKELCDLTGSQAIKHRKVRLKVAEGHPEGPMRCLEEFINSNINDDGEPVFPDYQDVKRCVQKANAQYNLAWNAGQVRKEAQALFTQYGSAMQKWRQQREWRDLMSHVKEETEIDPADNDPELFARLEENKQIALKNEQDLLERFANIESERKESNPALRVDLSGKRNSSEDCSENEEITVIDKPCETKINSPNHKACSSTNTKIEVFSHYTPASTDNFNDNDELIPKHTNEKIGPVMDKESEMNTTSLDPHTQMINSNSNEGDMQLKCPNSQDKVLSVLVLEELKIIQPVPETRKLTATNDQICDEIRIPTSVEEKKGPNDHTASLEATDLAKENIITKAIKRDQTEDSSINNDGLVAKIKSEPEDIPAMLENLGSNFTATIIDIEDPFLVIEISSDSDSEEDLI